MVYIEHGVYQELGLWLSRYPVAPSTQSKGDGALHALNNLFFSQACSMMVPHFGQAVILGTTHSNLDHNKEQWEDACSF